MAFNMFPYSNLHNLNLDWILNVVKTMAAAVEAAASTVESYAARLTQVETDVEAITPAASGAVRHDVSQSLDAGNRRRAATNIHAVSYDSTVLTTAEKQQARLNIGAADNTVVTALAENISALENSRVSYAAAQTLTSGQQAQARSNIGAAAASDIPQPQAAVLYTEQELTSAQQQQARLNIGAASPGDIPLPQAAVLYTEQTLSSGQQAQARENIGAAAASDIPAEALLVVISPDVPGTGYEANVTLTEILSAVAEDRVVVLSLQPIGESMAYYGTIIADATTVSAHIINMQAPGSVIASRVYNVSIINNGSSDVITVSYNDFRTAPDCSISDAGKILTVGSNGRPHWEDPAGPLVLEFATEDPYTVTTPLAEIKAAIDAGRQVWFDYNTRGCVTEYNLTAGAISFLVFSNNVRYGGEGWTTR